MDDDPTPAVHKRAIFKKLDDFLYELSEVDHRGCVNYSFAADHLAKKHVQALSGAATSGSVSQSMVAWWRRTEVMD